MEWLDVVLFAVIVMVGFGFARMGFRLCSRSPVKVAKEGKDAKGGGAEDSGSDDSLSKIDRLVPGVLFAGFGMVIIWVAISRYLPLALEGDESRPSSTETGSSEVLGEVLLKVMVLRPTSSTGEPGQGETPAVSEVGVKVEKLSSAGSSLEPSGGPWQWVDVAHHKPLPRPTLFAGNP